MKTKLLTTTIQSIKSPQELEDFVVGILTPAELEQVNNRIKVIQMLKSGTPQLEISEKLGVGIATVTRGSKMLNEGKFKYIAPSKSSANWRKPTK